LQKAAAKAKKQSAEAKKQAKKELAAKVCVFEQKKKQIQLEI